MKNYAHFDNGLDVLDAERDVSHPVAVTRDVIRNFLVVQLVGRLEYKDNLQEKRN